MRDHDTDNDLIDLGAASVETKGGAPVEDQDLPSPVAFRNETGLTAD